MPTVADEHQRVGEMLTSHGVDNERGDDLRLLRACRDGPHAERLLESHNSVVVPWSLSPDGRWLAYHDLAGVRRGLLELLGHEHLTRYRQVRDA